MTMANRKRPYSSLNQDDSTKQTDDVGLVLNLEKINPVSFSGTVQTQVESNVDVIGVVESFSIVGGKCVIQLINKNYATMVVEVHENFAVASSLSSGDVLQLKSFVVKNGL